MGHAPSPTVLIPITQLSDTVWTIARVLEWSTEFLGTKGVGSARLDAELLLAAATSLERLELYTQWEKPLLETELKAFKTLLQRRAEREPLAYILGRREFFSMDFQVSPGVLIPRPETELLVEKGLEHLNALDNPKPQILDLMTGSGCVLIALLKHLPGARGLGVDISREALVMARENARTHGVEDRVHWISLDLSQHWVSGAGLEEAPPESFDLITANPPYVSEAEWGELEPELRDFEPRGALLAGAHGTEAFPWILPHLPLALKPGGLALLEMGWKQEGSLRDLSEDFCPSLKVQFLSDLSSQARVLSLAKS